MLAEDLVWLGFLQFVSYIKTIPPHEKLFAAGKSGPNATVNLFFLGLSWPWVGEFVGFIIFICFPTQQNFGKSQTPYANGPCISVQSGRYLTNSIRKYALDPKFFSNDFRSQWLRKPPPPPVREIQWLGLQKCQPLPA